MDGDGGVCSLPHVAKTKKSCFYLRDRSCRLRCSLRLKARLQYWHLYFFSGTDAGLLGVAAVAVVSAASEAVMASGWAIARKPRLQLLRPGASLSLKSEMVQRRREIRRVHAVLHAAPDRVELEKCAVQLVAVLQLLGASLASPGHKC